MLDTTPPTFDLVDLILSSTSQPIAGVYRNFIDWRTNESHLRLIAAAPELLEALQALVTACGDVRPYQMGVVGPERDLPQILKAERFLDTYERAGKAIAKATGSAAC